MPRIIWFTNCNPTITSQQQQQHNDHQPPIHPSNHMHPIRSIIIIIFIISPPMPYQCFCFGKIKRTRLADFGWVGWLVGQGKSRENWEIVCCCNYNYYDSQISVSLQTIIAQTPHPASVLHSPHCQCSVPSSHSLCRSLSLRFDDGRLRSYPSRNSYEDRPDGLLGVNLDQQSQRSWRGMAKMMMTTAAAAAVFSREICPRNCLQQPRNSQLNYSEVQCNFEILIQAPLVCNPSEISTLRLVGS